MLRWWSRVACQRKKQEEEVLLLLVPRESTTIHLDSISSWNSCYMHVYSFVRSSIDTNLHLKHQENNNNNLMRSLNVSACQNKVAWQGWCSKVLHKRKSNYVGLRVYFLHQERESLQNWLSYIIYVGLFTSIRYQTILST